MLPTQLNTLLSDDAAGIGQAWEVVDGFDAACRTGLARPSPESAETLTALAAAVAATPLGERAAEAADKIAAGSISDDDLMVLAGARVAVLGAVHDALHATLDSALGRERAAWQPGAGEGTEGPLEAARAWLRELAVVGWSGVDHETVSFATQPIEALLAYPAHRRLATVLDGLAAELRACSPTATAAQVPTRRWSDLWSRAMLLAHEDGRAGGAAPLEAISGRLLPLGVDVHEHPTALQVQLHAVYESGETDRRLVRVSVSAPKVDAVTGPAVWGLFGDRYPVLLGALAGHRALRLSDMPLLASGDLVWQEESATVDEEVDSFATARLLLSQAQAPATPPLDRHPAQLAEPVFVEGYTSGDGVFDFGEARLPVDCSRLPACGPLTRKLVDSSSACIGLLRFDREWTLQPLAVQAKVKRQLTSVGTADWAQGPTDPKVAKATAKNDAVGILRERAGRLLRK